MYAAGCELQHAFFAYCVELAACKTLANSGGLKERDVCAALGMLRPAWHAYV